MRNILFAFIISFTLQSCQSTSPKEEVVSAPEVNLFNQDSLYSYNLLIHPDSLALIDSDPAAEHYVPAQLVFKGDTIKYTKIRYKGSRGAFAYCLSGKDWKNPSGRKTCTKLSMKLKLKKEFYGLKKLQFHSQNHDKSQMRERLGYYLFNKMDVPAPRSVHAKVYINNNYLGVFALTEQVNKNFVKRNYQEKSGNLYKETWPLYFNGHPRSIASFKEGLKTNKKSKDSTLLIADFARAIIDTTQPLDLNKWVSLKEIISFAVVDRVIRADDGPFHWYCNNGQCYNHNFYWYEEAESNKLHLIPWDLDNAFENITGDYNPVTPVADKWGETRNDCKPFPYGALQIEQMSASCDPLTAELSKYKTEFQDLKNKLFNNYLTPQHLDSVLHIWTNQIKEATLEENIAHPNSTTVTDYYKEIEALKIALQKAQKY